MYIQIMHTLHGLGMSLVTCVCVRARVKCLCMSVCDCICLSLWLCMCHVYVWVFVCICVYMYVYTCMHVGCVFLTVRVCVHTHTGVCVCVCGVSSTPPRCHSVMINWPSTTGTASMPHSNTVPQMLTAIEQYAPTHRLRYVLWSGNRRLKECIKQFSVRIWIEWWTMSIRWKQ